MHPALPPEAGFFVGDPMSAQSSKHDLLKTLYAAFNRRDIDAAFALMRPDVDWPNGMEGGRVHGHAEVRAYWQRQWGLIDPHVDPVRMEDDASGNTVVQVHQVIRDLTGKVLKDVMIEHVYSFEGNQVRRMKVREPEIQEARERGQPAR